MENKHTWEEVEKRFDKKFVVLKQNKKEVEIFGKEPRFRVDATIPNIKSFYRHEIDLAVKGREMDIRNSIVKLCKLRLIPDNGWKEYCQDCKNSTANTCGKHPPQPPSALIEIAPCIAPSHTWKCNLFTSGLRWYCENCQQQSN